jgi:cyclopropane fatty-acyl-phospholipid synthase-like methyltransferase
MISQEYAKQNRAIHATHVMWGASAIRYLEEITAHARHLNARTILDYGCGKGTLKIYLPKDLQVLEYDPGIPGKDRIPGMVDMVVSTDVLEHVEPEHVDATLVELGNLSVKGAFLLIALIPAGTWLPDGRNAHLSVHPPAWWEERLRALWTFPMNLRIEEYGRFTKKGEWRPCLKVWMEKT